MFEGGFIGINFLVFVGAYAFLQFLIDNLKSPFEILCSLICRRNKPLSERYGKWAVVTGSSDGIGKEYAKNLARKGMNLVLISRTASKLERLAKDLRDKFGVEVKCLPVDFGEGPHIYDGIRKELAGMDIGILVNNVGILHSHPVAFESLAMHEIEQTIAINVCSTVKLIHMVLPEMKLRRRGIVINISSSSGFAAIPYMQTYSSSKVFVNFLTLSLQQELRGTGVECQLVTPMLVNTNLSLKWRKVQYWNLVSVGVRPYARMAVWLIGRTTFTSGHWYHGIQITLFKIPPAWLITRILAVLPKWLLTRSNISF
ncbi:very-long-chain 3-oxoacyl-CoA reductase-like [Malaya genurostris]|uniref:very-long-chain 3-oxoacyl-CoA reductase-like n=1 Tax=Malaya genurostris TaxID=325434 RepID=UPI0026F40875|nr:very-long-chain 3-oxoacyl-CoA reductase-like [Malaya genurostris]